MDISSQIVKATVTSANETDADGARNHLPRAGAVIGDKGYVGTIVEIRRRGLHPMVIKRDNMKSKNFDLDKWLTTLRCPDERTFGKQNKRVHYKGVAKNQGAEFLYAIAYNFKRLVSVQPI